MFKKIIKKEDYSDILEKKLDKKNFNNSIKNLILSLMYKLEIAYPEYKKTKVLVPSEDKFFFEYIDLIENSLYEVEFLELEAGKAFEFERNIIDLNTGKISVYQNELSLFNALSNLKKKYFYIENDFPFRDSLREILVLGSKAAEIEILSDYDGWGWNPTNKKEYLEHLIYFNLVWIYGIEYINDWQENISSDFDVIDDLKEKFDFEFGKENREIFFEKIFKIFSIYSNNIKTREQIQEEKDKYFKIYEFMKNRNKFNEYLKTTKNRYNENILKIDKVIENEEYLNKAWNIKVEEGNTYSLDEYVKVLEEEKLKLKGKIKSYDNISKDEVYLRKLNDLEIYLKSDTTNIEFKDTVIEFQNIFLRALRNRINLKTEYAEIFDEIKTLRYYLNLEIMPNLRIQDVEELSIYTENIMMVYIKKIIELGKIRSFCKNEKMNLKLILEFLKTKILDLEDIRIEISKTENGIFANIYDKENWIAETEMVSKEKIKLEVKEGKIYKLFK